MTSENPLSPRYRAAIVGTGGIAAAHAAALAELDERIALVAAVDVDPERAMAFAARIHSGAAPSMAARGIVAERARRDSDPESGDS